MTRSLLRLLPHADIPSIGLRPSMESSASAPASEQTYRPSGFALPWT
ncbi:MAG: hypothetical protein ACOYL6_00810 [Bacteriovoracaceae bacterium]